jgi:hypothetical protein
MSQNNTSTSVEPQSEIDLFYVFAAGNTTQHVDDYRISVDGGEKSSVHEILIDAIRESERLHEEGVRSVIIHIANGKPRARFHPPLFTPIYYDTENWFCSPSVEECDH